MITTRPAAPLELGRQAELDGRLEEAEAHYVAALEGARTAGDTRTERLALCHLGGVLAAQDRVADAAAALQQAVPLADGAVDRSAPAAVRLMLTDVYLADDSPVDALPWADAAVRAAVASSSSDASVDDELLAAACATYVRTTRQIGDDPRTLRSTAAHLAELLQVHPSPPAAVDELLFVHGVALLQAGQRTRALATLEDALALADATEADLDRGGLLTAIGYTAMELGERGRAREAFTAGLEHGGPARVALLSGLALLDWERGWHERALTRLDQAERLARSERAPVDRAEVLSTRATLYEQRGELDLARRDLDDASDLLSDHGPAEAEARARGRLARVNARQRRWAEAEMEALRSLARNRSRHDQAGQAPRYLAVDAGVDALVALAQVHRADEELDEARASLRQALGLLVGRGLHERAAYVAAAQGFLALDLGDPRLALETFDALRGAEEAGELPALWQAAHGAGMAHAHLGDFDAAEAALARAVDLVERGGDPGEDESLPWLPGERAPFMALVELLLEQERHEEAFALTCRARRAAGQAMDPGQVEELRQHLDDGDAALVYLVGAERAVAWVVTADWLTPVRSSTGRVALEQATLDLLVALQQPPQHGRRSGEAWREPAGQLYDLALGPVAEELRHTGKVWLLPDGPLAHVPFAALVPLDADVEVPRVHVAVVRGGGPRHPPTLNRRTAAVAIGDPAATRPLDETGEFAALQQACRKAAVLDLEQATEETVRQRLGEVVVAQVATRVEYNPAYGGAGCLRLEEGGGHDGRLHVREIRDLSAAPALVVLTGGAAEPLVGLGADEHVRRSPASALSLAGAFGEAGADSVLVGLWPVDDASRQAVLVEFYAALGRADAGTALQQVQGTMAAGGVHPHHWAGWIVAE